MKLSIKISIILMSCLSILNASNCENINYEEVAQMSPNNIHCYLDNSKQGIVGLLPLTIDKVTVLKGFKSNNNSMTYTYSMNMKKMGIGPKRFKKAMNENIIKNICSLEYSKYLINNGVTVHQEYYDENNKLLLKSFQNKKICNDYNNKNLMNKKEFKILKENKCKKFLTNPNSDKDYSKTQLKYELECYRTNIIYEYYPKLPEQKGDYIILDFKQGDNYIKYIYQTLETDDIKNQELLNSLKQDDCMSPKTLLYIFTKNMEIRHSLITTNKILEITSSSKTCRTKK